MRMLTKNTFLACKELPTIIKIITMMIHVDHGMPKYKAREDEKHKLRQVKVDVLD